MTEELALRSSFTYIRKFIKLQAERGRGEVCLVGEGETKQFIGDSVRE